MPAFWMEATLYTMDSSEKSKSGNSEWSKFLKKWQEQIMRAGVKRFLKATLPRIPRRTGFLRGAFGDIKRAYSDSASFDGIGEAALVNRIFGDTKQRRVSASGDDPADREARIQAMMKKHSKHAGKGPKNARDRLREFYYASAGGKKTRILKTPASGIQFATPPDKVLTFNDNVATFFLDVTISYYRINDNYSRIKGSPWHSLMEGGSALANWLGRAADLFPNITEILVKQKISLRGSRITQTKLPQELVASRFLRITGFEGAEPAAPTGAAPASAIPNSKLEHARNRILALRSKKNVDYREQLLKKGEYQQKLREAGIEPKKKRGKE